MTTKMNAMLHASKAHESMMKEGRGLYLWGIATRAPRIFADRINGDGVR